MIVWRTIFGLIMASKWPAQSHNLLAVFSSHDAKGSVRSKQGLHDSAEYQKGLSGAICLSLLEVGTILAHGVRDEGPVPGACSVMELRVMLHAFPDLRHRQCHVDKRHNLLRKVWRAATADPLRVTTVDHEASCFESSHVAGHAGLTRPEFAHQFANTMLPPIPHHSKGFEPNRLMRRLLPCCGPIAMAIPICGLPGFVRAMMCSAIWPRSASSARARGGPMSSFPRSWRRLHFKAQRRLQVRPSANCGYR